MLSAQAATAVKFVSQLVQGAGVPSASVRLQADSRAVKPGDIFVAIPGDKHDGRDHLAAVAQLGALAALWDPTNFDWPSTNQLPHCAVENLKLEIGAIASKLLGEPSKQLQVFAFTGTSGKTTCTTWAAQLLAMLGEPCAIIGTRGAGLPAHLSSFGLTTPQAVDLQQWFAQFSAQKVTSCAIEASSIGLEEGRLNGTQITCALFTNLTQDHLDYHGDMARYARAKAKLFSWPNLKQAVINIDDPASELMISSLGKQTELLAISLNPIYSDLRTKLPNTTKLTRLWASEIKFIGNQTYFTVDGDFGRAQTSLQVPGRFNVANALLVVACALLHGFSLDTIAKKLSQLEPVEGRMQSLGGIGQTLVVIDYAHKPDALEQVLVSLRSQANARGGRLWCVFGCGGDRDASKRPIMGAIAERLADQVLVTSDNPRSESPALIAQAIVQGMKSKAQIELDRARAIAQAISMAGAADVVLIAGKGHENYQEIGSNKTPFSDFSHAQASLNAISIAAGCA
jgi:UDP-N-acetylmuramyl-tripeptide synthetase